MKVHVYQDEVGEYRWQLRADNGEIIADSAEGYRHKCYCITVAQTINPGAELVIDDKSEGWPDPLTRDHLRGVDGLRGLQRDTSV